MPAGGLGFTRLVESQTFEQPANLRGLLLYRGHVDTDTEPRDKSGKTDTSRENRDEDGCRGSVRMLDSTLARPAGQRRAGCPGASGAGSDDRRRSLMGQFGELLALAPAALLRRAGLAVDDDGNAGDLAKRPLHRIQLAPVMDRHNARVPSSAACRRGTGLFQARADVPAASLSPEPSSSRLPTMRGAFGVPYSTSLSWVSMTGCCMGSLRTVCSAGSPRVPHCGGSRYAGLHDTGPHRHRPALNGVSPYPASPKPNAG